MENHYTTLGVDKNASQDEIKKKFRELSKQHHPDKGGDEEVFKKINEAYSVLGDPDKRKEYDNPRTHSMGGNVDDIYEQMFRMHNRNRSETVKISPNVNINLSITLDDVFKGVTKSITYTIHKVCMPCNGEGGTDPISCENCGGSGTVVSRMGAMIMQRTCSACQGSGKKFKNTCTTCNSFGYVGQNNTVSINIPPSVLENEVISYHNYGNEVKPNLFGSLNVRISVNQHDKFIRPVDAPFDLIHEVELPYHDMVLGCDKIIPTISGTNVKITVPEYTLNGKILRLKGQGLKQRQNGVGVLSTRGDMHVVVTVKMPTNLTEREREILKQLKTSETSTIEV
jgi:molecular chaperone DnaJ